MMTSEARKRKAELDALAGAFAAETAVPPLEEIRARAEAATPGPWRAAKQCVGFDDDAGLFRLFEVGNWAIPADAEFIAHARMDIPLLLAALDESRAEVAEWRDVSVGPAYATLLREQLLSAEARATAAEAVVASVRSAIAAPHEPTGIPESAVRWYLLGQQTAARRIRAALAPTTTDETGDES